MNIAAQRRANILSTTNLALMFSLVFMAGVMLLVKSETLASIIFYFTLARIGMLLFTNDRWIINPMPMMVVTSIVIGNVIGYLI